MSHRLKRFGFQEGLFGWKRPMCLIDRIPRTVVHLAPRSLFHAEPPRPRSEGSTHPGACCRRTVKIQCSPPSSRSVSDPSDPSSEIEVLIEEATRHLEASLTAIRDLDRRIEALARFDAILVGLVVAGLSVWSRAGPSLLSTPASVLVALGLGLGGLLASAGLAVWAYVDHQVAIGLHPSDLRAMTTPEAWPPNLKIRFVEGYVGAIATNFVVLARSTRRFRIALFTWIASVSLLALGTIGLMLTTTP